MKPAKKKKGNPFAKGGALAKGAPAGGKKGSFVPGKKGVNPFAKKKGK
jgi:hypothetical protein